MYGALRGRIGAMIYGDNSTEDSAVSIQKHIEDAYEENKITAREYDNLISLLDDMSS